MTDNPHIETTTIIIAYHGDRWLPSCVQTLADAAECRFDVVLLDNGGNESIESLKSDHGDIRVIHSSGGLGFAEANNVALRTVSRSAEAVCLLNQDTVSEPGWLDACVQLFELDRSIGAVTPLLRTYDWSGWDPGFFTCAKESEAFQRDLAAGNGFREWYELPRITAAVMVVRADVLRKVGPFDPIFGSYYEDYDLCQRIRRAGYKVGIAAHARVAHYSGSATRTPAAERRRMKQIIRNRAICELREAGDKRLGVAFKQWGIDLPRRLARGLVGTSSSQPPGVVLAAHWELFKLMGRLNSERRDGQAWRRYLDQIGWTRPCNEPDLINEQAVGTDAYSAS